MEQTQWAKIKELFGAASDLEPSQREAFLRDACKGDEGLLAEVESLLIAHDKSKCSIQCSVAERTTQGHAGS